MKGIWILTIVLAFVAGSVLTGSMAYAVPNGQPFQALFDAIDNLQGQIDDIAGGNTLANLDCESDQIVRFVEDEWVCGTDRNGLILGNVVMVSVPCELGAHVGEFWGAPQDDFGGQCQPNNDILSINPVLVPQGTITNIVVEGISPRSLPASATLYLDGVATSLGCTIPAGQLTCSSSGSVQVVGIGEIVMKNEGPAIIADPTGIVTIQLNP